MICGASRVRNWMPNIAENSSKLVGIPISLYSCQSSNFWCNSIRIKRRFVGFHPMTIGGRCSRCAFGFSGWCVLHGLWKNLNCFALKLKSDGRLRVLCAFESVRPSIKSRNCLCGPVVCATNI